MTDLSPLLSLAREIIARATHLVDLHCGDGNESLRPYSYWITTGDPKVAAAGRDVMRFRAATEPQF